MTDPARYEFIGGPLDTEILWPLYELGRPGVPLETIYIAAIFDRWKPWVGFRREPESYPITGYYKYTPHRYNALKSTYIWTVP